MIQEQHFDRISNTLPETNSSPLKLGLPKRKLIFQPSIVRGELLVLGRVNSTVSLASGTPASGWRPS